MTSPHSALGAPPTHSWVMFPGANRWTRRLGTPKPEVDSLCEDLQDCASWPQSINLAVLVVSSSHQADRHPTSANVPSLFNQRKSLTAAEAHLAGGFLNHLLWLSSSPVLCSIRAGQTSTHTHTLNTNWHKTEHMQRQGCTHAFTLTFHMQTLTCIHTDTHTGRQPPAGRQAERGSNLPQATCSSSPQWVEEELWWKGRVRQQECEKRDTKSSRLL